MKTRVDARLRDEAARYRLRFACDDCAHFAVERGRCSLSYPAAPRRDALERESLETCKEFELA
jgi:hypothetical protein